MQFFIHIFLALFISVNIPMISHAGKHSGISFKTQQKSKRAKLNHKDQKAAEANLDKAKQCQLRKPKFSAKRCRKFNRVHAVAAGALLIALVISTNLDASPPVLPYEFELQRSFSDYHPYPKQALPSPLTVDIMAAAAMPCLNNHQPNNDVTTAINVAHPGLIYAGSPSASYKEASAKHFTKLNKKQKCVAVKNEKIICSVEPEDMNVVVVDGKRQKIDQLFEQEISAEVWRQLKRDFLDPAKHNPTINPVKEFFASERFVDNLTNLYKIFLTGTSDSAIKNELDEHHVLFIERGSLFRFDTIDSWPTIIKERAPELETSYNEIVEIAQNLERHIYKAPKFFKQRYDELKNNDGLNPKTNFVLAFKLASFSGIFEQNQFLLQNFLYVQKYPPHAYGFLLENLREKTLELYERDPIQAAAYFLTRLTQIRPFHKANGRVARTVLNLILMSDGHQPVAFLSSKQYLESCAASYSKENYLLADFDEFGAYCTPDFTPFEELLRATMITQAGNKLLTSLLNDLRTCEQDCQLVLDGYVFDNDNSVQR